MYNYNTKKLSSTDVNTRKTKVMTHKSIMEERFLED